MVSRKQLCRGELKTPVRSNSKSKSRQNIFADKIYGFVSEPVQAEITRSLCILLLTHAVCVFEIDACITKRVITRKNVSPLLLRKWWATAQMMQIFFNWRY